MNKLLFDKIYFFTINHNIAKKTAVFISEFSKPAFIIIYILGIIAVLINNCEGIVKIIAVPFLTLLFNTTLRKFLNKPRPFTRNDVVNLVEHENNGSFPSNHACSSMIISLSYIMIYPPLVPVFIILAFFTGFSRVATGVHYPLDIFAGWIISFVSGIIFFNFL